MPSVKELRENYGKVVNDLRELSVRVHKENDGLYTPEHKATFEKLNQERIRLEGNIESAEIDNTIAGVANTVRGKVEEKLAHPTMKGTDFYRQDAETALKGWLLRHKELTTEYHRNAAARCGLDYAENNNTLLCNIRANTPAWQTRTGALEGTNSLGGYTVVPDLIASEIDIALKYYCPFRDICRVFPTATGGQPLLFPTVDDTSVLAEAHTEATADTEQDWTLSQVSVPATTQFSTGVYPISVELLQDSVIPITEVIAELAGIRIGRSMASSFTTTLKSDISNNYTTAASGTCTYVDIQGFVWSPDIAYLRLPSLGLMCSQSFISNAYSLVDSNNRPLMSMSIDSLGRQYATLLGYRVIPNNYLSTVAAGNVVAVIGPWEKALVRDAGPLVMKVLNERYMDQMAVGIIGWQRSSYKTIRPQGFYKLTVHT
jgi:HK97 family phage major capsid protein